MRLWKAGLAVVVILAVIGSVSFYYCTQRKNFLSESYIELDPQKPSIYHYKQTIYFVPVVGVKSYLQNTNFNELRNRQIVILESDKEFLSHIFLGQNVEFKSFDNFDNFSKFLNSDLTQIGVINFSELNFRVKSLSFDNIFLLDRRSDISKYALKFEKNLISHVPKKDISNIEQTELRNIAHTGSMIPARGVEIYIRRHFNGDFTRLFQSTKPLFDSIDYVSSTFEAPVLGNGKPCVTCLTFVGPDEFMEGVKYSGIDFFTLAANHIMDGGVEALKNTQNKLDDLNIKYTGASTLNNDNAGKPVLVDVNGLKIAYLGFNDTPGREQWANENKPGAASISDWDIDSQGRTIRYEPNVERIKYFLQRAKSLNPDLIVVLMHWGGVEYEAQPTPYTRNLANLLINNGADVIFGDHPHWVQEIEYINGKPVFYSVGNFIFDQTWSIETMQGMTVELNLYKNKILNFKLHPHQSELPKTGMIRLLNPSEPEYKQTLERVFKVSNLY